MENPPQSLSGLIATVCRQASNPPPYFPPESTAAASTSTSASSTVTDDPALTTLSLLQRAQQLASSLSVVSDNDALRDISTSSLRVLFLDSLRAELEIQVRTGRDHAARKARLRSSLVASARFLSRMAELNVLPPQTRSLVVQLLTSARLASVLGHASEAGEAAAATNLLDNLELPAGAPRMPPRDLKITSFKLERALKQSLDEFRSAFAQSKLSQRGLEKQPADPFFDLLLFSAEDMRHSAAGRSRGGLDGDEDDDDDDDEDDEEEDAGSGAAADSAPSAESRPRDVRQYLLLLLNYHSLKTASLVSSSSQELELLQNMPPPPPDAPSDATAARDAEQDAEWRLDSSLRAGKGWSGPLLDERGKPMRPFTITSSSSGAAAGADRQSIKDSVFRPSHRLPTMSIDEFLDEEQRRGNILTGGGHEGAAKATPREARALRAENDGTREAEEAEEEARLEAVNWDRFTEENKRGAGNTMNRG
ncbi:uncharacterized protein PFL1_01951 [Pseudozyma flocculosa PF-1]|uniref:Related to TAP42 - component of the Tor signaling pathway n=1 Tax=Pseudozyma flocculosa TaxID=84751 RepID=A0A5C3EZJ6_9BASI|nr:uncharacterized protein PFL1_01951 [Pseudozyma flocculosa PF-1]EPQ30425.1 hypothetical protein PFL1_01951 [Pseudozyma flocculosa PF-1]SPO37502.1 related to TAP42 - component of the Tor signaling pathway [Pseudozyma flocculosa]